jgi:Tfp pilus assembly protein PilF
VNLTGLIYTPAKAVAATAQITDILKNEPNYVPALMVMGVINEQNRNAAGAAELYEKVLALYPDFAPAQRQLAIIYSRDNTKLARGYSLATKCRDFYSNDPTLAKATGMILYQQGDYSHAVVFLRTATQVSDDAEAFYYLGAAQLQLKDPAGSKASLQRALDLKLTGDLAQAAQKLLQQIK